MSDTGPLFVSSGDLIADRRYKWAIDQAARGDFVAAADILAQTVEIAPAFATAWFALGAIRDQLGDRSGAIAAFEKTRDADPDDYHGARLQLARLGSGETTPAMSEAYVRRLFDQYAARFDTALTERLAYRGPAVLRQAVEQAVHAAQRPLRFSAMLDLGCGTGLAGAAFAPLADRLVGVDLSPAMVAQAESKQLYDRLATGELAAFLKGELRQRRTLRSCRGRRRIRLCQRSCAGSGRDHPGAGARRAFFAFTVETHPDEGVKLLQTLRYAHGEPYIRRALAAAGLTAASIAKAAVRSEKGVPVDSLVVIAVASTLPNVPATFQR